VSPHQVLLCDTNANCWFHINDKNYHLVSPTTKNSISGWNLFKNCQICMLLAKHHVPKKTSNYMREPKCRLRRHQVGLGIFLFGHFLLIRWLYHHLKDYKSNQLFDLILKEIFTIHFQLDSYESVYIIKRFLPALFLMKFLTKYVT
jgi:hypothetical protein